MLIRPYSGAGIGKVERVRVVRFRECEHGGREGGGGLRPQNQQHPLTTMNKQNNTLSIARFLPLAVAFALHLDACAQLSFRAGSYGLEVPGSMVRSSSKADSSKHRSPYRLGWGKDAALLGGSTLLYITGKNMEGGRTQLTEAQAAAMHHGQVNWLDRHATYRYDRDLMEVSDQLGVFTFAAPVALMLDRRARGIGGQVAVMFAETYLLAQAMPALAKGAFPRYRPYVYDPTLSYEEKTLTDPGKAFFAQQTTLTFASAAFVATVYSDLHPGSKANKWVWAGSMGAASAIAVVRHESGKHYATDILAGAAVGTAIGYGIPWLHRAQRGNKLQVSPLASRNYQGLSLSLKLDQ